MTITGKKSLYAIRSNQKLRNGDSNSNVAEDGAGDSGEL